MYYSVIEHTTLLSFYFDVDVWSFALQPGVPAFTVSQPETSGDVLLNRAREKGVNQSFCEWEIC